VYEKIRVIFATIERYIRLDLKYKFQFLIDSLIIAGNFLGFGIMGFYLQARGSALPPGYTFEKFMLVGTYFWTMLTKIYDDCTKVLMEEANRGTLTLLIENNITIPVILIGRAIASTLKYGLIASIFGIPALYLIDALKMNFKYLPLALLSFTCSWLFIIGLSALLLSIILIFKRVGMLTVSIMEILMFAIGFYFPVELLPKEIWPILGAIPFTIGLQFFRDLMIIGEPRPMINGVYSSINMGIMKMFIGSLIFSMITFTLMYIIMKKAQRWGTIEQY